MADREKPDLVVCPGDISSFGEGYGDFLRELAKLRRDICFNPGNHDDAFAVQTLMGEFPFMRDLENRAVEAAGGERAFPEHRRRAPDGPHPGDAIVLDGVRDLALVDTPREDDAIRKLILDLLDQRRPKA